MLRVPYILRSANRSPTRKGVRTVFMVFSLASIGLAACGAPVPAASPSARPTASVPASPTGSPANGSCRQQQAVVGNTEGQGVNLRKSPGGEIITAYPEGTKLTVCAEKEADGQRWYQVIGEDGVEGWVLSTYVMPASPTPSPGG